MIEGKCCWFFLYLSIQNYIAAAISFIIRGKNDYLCWQFWPSRSRYKLLMSWDVLCAGKKLVIQDARFYRQKKTDVAFFKKKCNETCTRNNFRVDRTQGAKEVEDRQWESSRIWGHAHEWAGFADCPHVLAARPAPIRNRKRSCPQYGPSQSQRAAQLTDRLWSWPQAWSC